MFKEELIIAGFGGQGVLSMGKILAYSGVVQGLEVTWMPSYGPEMRGGTANVTVILSDERISSPIAHDYDTAVILNQQSMDKFEPKVKPGGEVHITATVTNNSGKDIVSTLPIYNQQHYEIRTKILTQGGKAFYDKDYPVEMTEDATRRFIIRSGESYVQNMYLVAAEMDSGMSGTADAVPYGAGKCAGTSTFKWDGSNGAEKSLTVSFEIEIA